MSLGGAASTGVPSFDRALGGLHLGDNVVWELEDGARLEPFLAAIADAEPAYERLGHVTLAGDEPVDPRFELLDARPGTPLAQAQALLAAVREWCNAAPGSSFLLFDSLEVMAERWGGATARRFFSRACPMLLELGAIAYWSLPTGWRTRELRRTAGEITQCLLVLGDARLRVAKADGRGPGVQGSVWRCGMSGGAPTLSPAPAATRVGAALKALRTERQLSQSELARAAGVSASAISQAERGRRGLSVDTLLTLAEALGLTLDELLFGRTAPGYRLGRRDHARTADTEAVIPLLDDPRAGLRVFLVTLPPGGVVDAPLAHRGVESVSVATGLVQVVLGAERTVLRRGEALLGGASGVTQWRNLGDRRAQLFWTLRDDPPPSGRS